MGKLTETRPRSRWSGLIQFTIPLTNRRAVAAKTKAYRCFTITVGFSTKWRLLRVFPSRFFTHPLLVVRASPHAASDHTARRALEGCGSCLQEPTNESDIVVVIVEFVFLIVDTLQGLQVELVPE